MPSPANWINRGRWQDEPSGMPDGSDRTSATDRGGDSGYAVSGDDVWSAVLRQIKTIVNLNPFITWFWNSTLVRDLGSIIEVKPASTVHADWITKFYCHQLREAVNTIRPGATVKFVLAIGADDAAARPVDGDSANADGPQEKTARLR